MRHGIAVLDQRRHVELDLAGLDRGAAGDVADGGGEHRGRRLGGPNRDDGDCAKHGCATGEAEELAAG